MSPDRSLEPHAAAGPYLFRFIRERWANFVSKLEQQAHYTPIAAGLVERRIGVPGELAGPVSAIEFTIEVKGEYGVVEMMDRVPGGRSRKFGSGCEGLRRCATLLHGLYATLVQRQMAGS